MHSSGVPVVVWIDGFTMNAYDGSLIRNGWRLGRAQDMIEVVMTMLRERQGCPGEGTDEID